MAIAVPMTSCMSLPMMATSTISHRAIRGTCNVMFLFAYFASTLTQTK